MTVEFSGPKGLFCVYCLHSEAEKSKGRCYIGFTPTPQRRLRQHNGEIVGGARRTKKGIPWRMGCFVYGFPTKIAGLKFEYVWTYPQKSKYVGVLRSPGRRIVKPLTFKYAMDALATVLSTQFYINQPLGINFLHYDLFMKYKSLFKYHEVRFEPVFSIKKGLKVDNDKIYQLDSAELNLAIKCNICSRTLDPCNCSCCYCGAQFCMTCLASHMTSKTNDLIPIEGECYKCKNTLIWKHLLLQTSENLQRQLDDRPEESTSSSSSGSYPNSEMTQLETYSEQGTSDSNGQKKTDDQLKCTPEKYEQQIQDQGIDTSLSVISIDSM